MKSQKHSCKTSIRANYLSNTAVTLLKGLAESVLTAKTLESFKNRLDDYWKDLRSVYEPTFRPDS